MISWRRGLLFVFLFVGLSACKNKSESLLDKAIYESSRQRTQVAQYLFTEIIGEHKTKDFIRFQALVGLKNLFLTQRFDYKRALAVSDQIIKEYGPLEGYEPALRQVRTQGAEIWRVHFEDTDKSLDLLSPLVGKDDLSVRIEEELAKTYLANRNFEMAEYRFKRAWVKASTNNDCLQAKTLQLEIMQTYALSDRCEESLAWSKQKLPTSCKPDDFAMAVEKAHCYEMMGQVSRAIDLYKNFLKERPNHARASFFLDRLEKRKKDRSTK